MTREYRSSRPRTAAGLRRWVVVCAIAALLPAAAPALAADASLEFDVGNAYIWRGIVFNDSGVLQFSLDAASLNVGSVPLSFNVWGNYDLGDFDGQLDNTDLSEVDLTVSAGLPAGFEVGYIEYHFPQSPASTREFYGSWSYEAVVSPTVTFYYDFGAVDDFYATLELGYGIPLGDKTSLDFSALGAIAGEDFAKAYGGEKGGFYNYNLSASLSHTVNDIVGLSLSGGYSGSLDTAVLPDQPLGGWIMGGITFTLQ